MLNTLAKPARALALAATIAIGTVGFSAPASAFTIYCTNCASTFQQAAQIAKEIETALNTAQSVRTQIQQYQDMLAQGKSLPANLVNRLTGDLQRLQSVYQQSKSLSGDLTDFDAKFRNQFKDYNSYLTAKGTSASYMQSNYSRWNEQGFESMRVAMRASGMNVSSIADEDDLLSQLVEKSQSASGRMQAMQAGNQIAAMQVQQMMKLRQLLNTQIQSQSMWYAQQMERQSIDDAGRQKRRTTTIDRSGGKKI